MRSINCNGRLIDLSVPRVMGILNLTPDSFYDGGVLKSTSAIVDQAGEMLEEGATFLDVGGYSSRPGATDVPVQEEIDRVLPAITAIRKHFDQAIISVDTFRSEVARQALAAGAAMINDISGGQLDGQMMELAGQMAIPYICMHMRGTPQTMKSLNDYQDLPGELIRYFSTRMARARAHGVNDFIVDPGFGFAKDRTQNFQLLAQLELLSVLEAPMLIGISRKSMIYKTLEVDVQAALNGTTALHSIALIKGAHILRVHDVREAVECIMLTQRLKQASGQL